MIKRFYIFSILMILGFAIFSKINQLPSFIKKSREKANDKISKLQSITHGALHVIIKNNNMELPLLHTDVKSYIDDFLARVNVTQKFINCFDTTIEAIYNFPLPENSAVDSISSKIGSQRENGIIKERNNACSIYVEAKCSGRSGGLLDQQWANIFTQSIANVLPNDTIIIMISFVQEIKYRNGRYVYNFPIVVGLRYIPGKRIYSTYIGTEAPTLKTINIS